VKQPYSVDVCRNNNYANNLYRWAIDSRSLKSQNIGTPKIKNKKAESSGFPFSGGV
jgi:hypothetical protein